MANPHERGVIPNPLPNTREGYYKVFKNVRTLLDDIPSDQISRDHPQYYDYKCTANNIYALGLAYRDVIQKKLISHPFGVATMATFLAHDFQFMHGRMTTQEEIKFLNENLDAVIGYLTPHSNK